MVVEHYSTFVGEAIVVVVRVAGVAEAIAVGAGVVAWVVITGGGGEVKGAPKSGAPSVFCWPMLCAVGQLSAPLVTRVAVEITGGGNRSRGGGACCGGRERRRVPRRRERECRRGITNVAVGVGVKTLGVGVEGSGVGAVGVKVGVGQGVGVGPGGGVFARS